MEYPDSRAEMTSDYSVTGAQKLCEALLGRDLQGFDPKSSWNPMIDEPEDEIYYEDPGYSRLGHYVEITKFNTYQVGNIYEDMSLSGGSPYPYHGKIDCLGQYDNNRKPCYIFTDIFKRKSIPMPNGENVNVGSPILYYKANTFAKNLNSLEGADSDSQIYRFWDNMPMMQFNSLEDGSPHPYFTDFMEMSYGTPRSWVEDLLSPSPLPIEEPGFVSGTPYNKSTFLLLSAGSDSKFGTEDDIWNISGR